MGPDREIKWTMDSKAENKRDLKKQESINSAGYNGGSQHTMWPFVLGVTETQE